jgi:four helix bundle protein
MSTDYRKLIVWQKAKSLAIEVYRVTEAGPISRDYGLRDQMRRAAVSVPSNIAEGDERGGDREAVRYLFIAKGSLAELRTQLEIAEVVADLPSAEVARLTLVCEELSRQIGALIKSKSGDLATGRS